MVAPDARNLLDAWDSAAHSSAVHRGPLLVEMLGLAPDGIEALDLTVGSCDLRLVELRRQVFGPTLEAISSCDLCGATVELSVALDDLWPEPPPPLESVDGPGHAARPRVVDVEVAGQMLRCRLPSNRDLAELASTEASQRPAAFIELCVVGVDGDFRGQTLPPPRMSDEAIESLAIALADQDPGAAALVEVRCPCGATRQDDFDIRSFLWTELTLWSERTLSEVHLLASAYGWSESAILDLPPRRRRAYLDLCGW